MIFRRLNEELESRTANLVREAEELMVRMAEFELSFGLVLLCLTLMLLVSNFANTKWCKKPEN